MSYILAAHSDKGIKKNTNQDSVLAVKADTDIGEIAMLVVCDGMGGFDKGELASSTVIRAFYDWFSNRLTYLVGKGLRDEDIRREWSDIVTSQNSRIKEYGAVRGINLGTTIVAVLLYQNRYIVCNIGDSRAYKIGNGIEQITRDHSFVQREIDAGRMTEAEAEVSPQRSVILQCIGASEDVFPDFFSGNVLPGDGFVLCSDGFRHKVKSEEMYQYLNVNSAPDVDGIQRSIEYLTELNKYRTETDNISVAMVRVAL
jgi:serine/threonine protein phosphatase PrpC